MRVVSRGLWYVRLTVNQPDGTFTDDTKINQLWTSRHALLEEYTRRLVGVVRVTPVEPDREPLDRVWYRYWDDEEEHAWRYFSINRLYDTEERDYL